MRATVKLMGGAACVYLSLCALYYFTQDALIYQRVAAAPLPRNIASEPIEIRITDATQRGHLINPAIASPVIFYFGGNAEPAASYAHRFAALPARAYLIDYRGYGESEGAPSQRALVHDATAHVHSLTSAEDRVFLIGRSLGTGVASLAAAELGTRVAGMVLISPFCSFGNVVALHAPAFLPARLLLAHPFQVDAVAHRLTQPLTIVVGSQDTIVPPGESRCLAKAIGPTAETIELAAGHNDILSRDDLWQAIARMITSAAGAPPRLALP